MMYRQNKLSWVKACIGINLAIFGLWQVASPAFLYENFAVSWAMLGEGHYWVLISSVFSHRELWHLLLNMLVLYSFGSVLEVVLGPRRFWVFYFVAGLVGSLSHALVSNFLMNEPLLPAIGASGALAGVILVFSLKFPHEKILLFGLVPIPALVGALLFIGLDIWGLVEQTQGQGLPIGHGAHLGGAATGIIFYLFFSPKLSSRSI